MNRALLGGVFAVGTLAGLVAGGCGGGGGTGTGGTGGGAVTSTAAHSTAAHSSGVATTGTGTGGVMDGHSFEGALPIDVGTTLDGDLSPAGAVDYYTFEGTAGQVLVIYTYAQRSLKSAAFDPTWIDTVVTLFDANKKQIAENNDQIPVNTQDSDLYTILPSDGTYYVRVEDCWTWAQNPKQSCLGTADKTNTAYTLGINELDPMKAGTVKDAEATGNAPTPLTFEKYPGGGYYGTSIYGTFKDAGDVDVFSFTVPADAVTVPAGSRGVASLWLYPAGISGDGATSPLGRVSLVDPAAVDPVTMIPSKYIAQLYGPDYGGSVPRLSPAADLSKTFLVYVEHPATSAGAHDFYFLLQGEGSSNPVEANEAANDVITSAEKLTDAPDMNGGHHYYVDGDLVSATDVDHFQVPVSAGTTKIAVSCTAQRGGSGLRGFTADILDATGATTIGTVTEAANADARTGYITIPGSPASLVVRISAKSAQDPSVTSTFYRCGIHFQ